MDAKQHRVQQHCHPSMHRLVMTSTLLVEHSSLGCYLLLGSAGSTSLCCAGMLEVTKGSEETRLGVDFADMFTESGLYK